MGIVEEEADESAYWMELLVESRIVETSEVDFLMREANEFLAIVVASIKTAKKRTKRFYHLLFGFTNPQSAIRYPKLAILEGVSYASIETGPNHQRVGHHCNRACQEAS